MASDRRQHERHASCMPVWVCDSRSGMRRQGQVMNISVGGVYVVAACEDAPKPGKTIEVIIGTHSDQHGGFDLHRCERSARVVRTEDLGCAVGLALEFAGQFQQMGSEHHLMPC
jgi:hypothetical protein